MLGEFSKEDKMSIMVRKKIYMTNEMRRQIARWIINCMSETCEVCTYKESCKDTKRRLDIECKVNRMFAVKRRNEKGQLHQNDNQWQAQ